MYTTTSCYIGHSDIVWDNANFSTVHSRETAGGRLMGYEYTAVVQEQKWFINYRRCVPCVKQVRKSFVPPSLRR